AQVVAVDVRHRGLDALLQGDGPDPVRETGGVEATGVRDDPDDALGGEGQAVLDLADEGPGVPGLRVLEGVLGEDEHGELGEVVAGDDVEARRALEELAQGGEPVAVEPGAVADEERPVSDSRHQATLGARPPPAGPAKHWAMSSHVSAIAPAASRSVSARLTRCVTSRQKSRAGPVTRCSAFSGPKAHTSPAGEVSSTRTSSSGAARPLLTK